MAFVLFTDTDAELMNKMWQNHIFVEKIIKAFVSDHLDHAILTDIRGQLFSIVKAVRKPEDLWVTSGLYYPADHYFTEGDQKMSIQDLINNTDALQRLASSLGPQIEVSPIFTTYVENLIEIKIKFLPSLIGGS